MRGCRRGWAALLLAATGGLAGLGPILLVTAQPAWAFTAPVDMLKVGSAKYAFDPKVIEINVNDKVLWRNTKTDQRHTVTSDPGVAPFDSGEVPPGGSFEWKFKTKGTYTYHCEHHSEMTGTIVVKDPNEPPPPPPPTTATTAPPPTTTTTAAPTTTTTEAPTTTTTVLRPPAAVPPMPTSAAAPPPPPAPSTTSSAPSTTTTTTAPPAAPSSAPPAPAGEPPAASTPPPESSTTTPAPAPAETGDRIPTAAGPISSHDGKLDAATVALVSLLVLVGIFGAWTLIRVRPGRV